VKNDIRDSTACAGGTCPSPTSPRPGKESSASSCTTAPS
jgi:hypothetical protein